MLSENSEEYSEGYHTAQDISNTIIRSREVVNQSKDLLSRITSYNDQSGSPLHDLKKTKSLEHSFLESSLLSPTIRGYEVESAFQRENTTLLSQVSEMQQEIDLLRTLLQEKDLKIAQCEEVISILTNDKTLAQERDSLSSSGSVDKQNRISKKRVSLKISVDEKNQTPEKERLEQRLNNINKEYSKQVSINVQLKKMVQEISTKTKERKISEIEEKLFVSQEGIKKLSKRLEKTESILSTNVTPTRLERCSLNTQASPKGRLIKKSSKLNSHKSKR